MAAGDMEVHKDDLAKYTRLDVPVGKLTWTVDKRAGGGWGVTVYRRTDQRCEVYAEEGVHFEFIGWLDNIKAIHPGPKLEDWQGC